jgi:hypothetical protein
LKPVINDSTGIEDQINFVTMEAALAEERIFLYLSLTVRLFRVACMFTVLAFCMSRSKVHVIYTRPICERIRVYVNYFVSGMPHQVSLQFNNNNGCH